MKSHRAENENDWTLSLGFSQGERKLLARLARQYGFKGENATAKFARLCARMAMTDLKFVERAWERVCQYVEQEGFDSVEAFLDGSAAATAAAMAEPKATKIPLDPELAERLRIMAARLRLSRAQFIRMATADYLSRVESNPKFAADLKEKPKT